MGKRQDFRVDSNKTAFPAHRQGLLRAPPHPVPQPLGFLPFPPRAAALYCCLSPSLAVFNKSLSAIESDHSPTRTTQRQTPTRHPAVLATQAQHPMKLLLDFFPILLFFLAYKLCDIFVATGVAIAATFVQVGVAWFRHRRVPAMQWVTLLIIVVFGGLTLYLRDEQFIKWKPTVINWLFGLAFLLSQYVGKTTIIERLMGANLTLPQPVWQRLNLSWVLFFFVQGGANLYVMSHFDRDTWVNFKLFGMLGLTLVFMVIQSIFLARHLQDAKTGD